MISAWESKAGENLKCTSTKPLTFMYTESAVVQMPSIPYPVSKCSVKTPETALSNGGSHLVCRPLGKPFRKNTTSASVVPEIAVPLPTEPPFTTWAMFKKDFSVTTSTTSLRICAILELKDRPEILLCSSRYCSLSEDSADAWGIDISSSAVGLT